MGIRRRRRKLTTLMSRLDQRVRSVELKPFSLLTASEVAAAVEAGEAADRPDVLVSGAAPYEWTRIQDAYYYPKKLTGNNEDRVEIYLEADLDNLDVDGRLAVSGIHGTSTFDIDVDGENFTVLHIDAVDGGGVWTDRATWKHDPTQDQAAGVTITNTYSFRPETVGPVTWTTRQRLQTKRAVDSFEITGTTVTLTMNANHKFEVGDIFYTNILSDQASNDESRVASGIDGLFYITAITSNTIEYELVAGVDTPTGTVTPVADVYVYPVARRWAQTGSIWVDSSNNETYYWDGIRWVEFTPDTSVTQDDDPPSPPTGLTITSDILLPRNVVELTATWTPPTTSESGATLTDLAAHEIQWRTSTLEQWKTERVPVNLGSTYTFDAGQFAKEQFYYFQIYSVDSGDNFSSTPATATHTTAGSSSVTNIGAVRPTPPSVDTYLGTFTITWDGQVEDTSNVIQSSPPGVSTLYVHASTSSTFTPSDSTRVGTLGANTNQKYVYAPDYYGRTFYFALEIEDLAGSGSLYSRIVTGTGAQSVDVQEIANIIAAANIVPGSIVETETLVALDITGNVIRGNEIHGNLITANTLEADRINAGAIASQLLTSDVISTSDTDSGSRVRLTTAGLEAYNGSTRTFFVNSTNGSIQIASGSITIGGSAPATQSDLSSFLTSSDLNGYLTSAVAANTYAELSALGLYVTASDANNLYLTAVTANGLYISQSDNAGDYVTSISGSTITTGTISADRIGAGTFVGSSFKTADGTNKRILISGSSNTIKTYNSGDGDLDPRGTIEGTSSGLILEGRSGAQWSIGSSTAEYYGGDSTRPNLILGSTGVLFYGYSSSGTSGKGLLSLGSTLSQLRGPGGTSAPAVNATSTNLAFHTGSSGYDFVDDYTVRMETLASTAGVGNVGTLSDGTLYRGTSDSRLKTNVAPLGIGLDFVNSLNPVTFNWNTERIADVSIKNFGLIAQEVETQLQNSGVTANNNLVNRYRNSSTFPDFSEDEQIYTVDYSSMVPFLIKSIQELSNKVDSLESRIQELENR